MRSAILRILDFEELFRIYLFANTPPYIYRNFRENQSVKYLSEAFTSRELSKMLDRLVKKQDQNLKTLVSIYAIVIALSFKPYDEVSVIVENLDKYDIPWIKEIRDLIKANLTVEMYTEFKAEKNIFDAIDYDGTDATVTEVVHKPKILVEERYL